MFFNLALTFYLQAKLYQSILTFANVTLHRDSINCSSEKYKQTSPMTISIAFSKNFVFAKGVLH